jgi:hypothetical protein
VVEHLPSNHEELSSNPSTAKKKFKVFKNSACLLSYRRYMAEPELEHRQPDSVPWIPVYFTNLTREALNCLAAEMLIH